MTPFRAETPFVSTTTLNLRANTPSCVSPWRQLGGEGSRPSEVSEAQGRGFGPGWAAKRELQLSEDE